MYENPGGGTAPHLPPAADAHIYHNSYNAPEDTAKDHSFT